MTDAENDAGPSPPRPADVERVLLRLIAVGLVVCIGLLVYLRWDRGESSIWEIEPKQVRVTPELPRSDVVPAGAGDLEGVNVLFITLDTTRADRIGCYGHEEAQTKALDRLAREGVVFSDAMAPAPTTLPSHASLMTGMYPYHHGARANGLYRLGDEHTTLAESLAGEGYSTGAVVSASVLDSQFGIARGFQAYDDEWTDEMDAPSEKDHSERRGDATASRAEEWLRDHAADKFFLWVHFYDPHFPYEAPGSDGLHPYDAEIAFVDAQIDRLLRLLDDLALTDQTLVVVAGDHGEGLGQHNEGTHACLIYQSTQHVPLLLRCGTRLGGGLHVNRLVSLVDVMPTVLTLLGIDAPSGLDGVDLTRPDTEERWVYFETLQGLADYGWAALLGVRNQSTKYILGPYGELFDLHADPFEERDLSVAQPELAAAMKSRLQSFFGEDLAQATSAEIEHDLDAETLAKLQSLGYLGGGGAGAPSGGERPHPRDVIPLQARVSWAQTAERTEGLDKSIQLLTELVNEHPDFFMGRLTLGRAYLKAADLERAEAEFSACLSAHPHRWEPLIALARLRLRQRQAEEALTLFRTAAAQHPEHPVVLKGLARLLMERGELDEASSLFTKALRIWPSDDEVPDMLFESMRGLGRVEEVTQLLEELHEAHPGLPMLVNALSRGLILQQKYAKAVELLRSALELAPHNPTLANNLALALVTTPEEDLRQPQEAAALMERICFENDYQDPRYLQTLALTYSEAARLDEAIAVAERAREIAASSDNPAFAAHTRGIGVSLEQYRKLKDMGWDHMRFQSPGGEGPERDMGPAAPPRNRTSPIKLKGKPREESAREDGE